MSSERSVLITGCSSGIGRALAVAFARRGCRVFASARNKASLADLAGDRIEGLALDVTDAASIEAAVSDVLARAGRIDVLVNNAGYGLMGPVAEVPPAELRRQLETNVVGPLCLVQAVVPAMVRQGGGVIVNVGSVSGVLPTPFSGAYCASKAALHALTDVLRVELRPFGVRVVSLQPGGIVSRFGDTAAGLAGRTLREGSLYGAIAARIEQRARTGQEGAMDADAFAAVVADRILSPEPPPVIRLGVNSWKLPAYRALVPVRLLDRILSKRFGLDGLVPRTR